MQLFDNPLIEVFIPLALALLLPLQFGNVTFLTAAQAPSSFLGLYLILVMLILLLGYRLSTYIALLCYGYTGFLFILHQSIMANNAPNYSLGVLYLGVFLLIAAIQGEYRFQFWLMLLGAGLSATVFLAIIPAITPLGAGIGSVIGYMISRNKRLKLTTDIVFNLIAALVTSGIAVILIGFIFSPSRSDPQLLCVQGILFLLGMGVQIFFMTRERTAKLRKELPGEEKRLTNVVTPPAQIAPWLLPFVRVRRAYRLVAKFVSPVLTALLVIYLTLTTRSLINANILPLPEPFQNLMKDYTAYTRNYLDAGSLGKPTTRYYAKFDGGVDVMSCPRITCSVVNHYLPGQRLEDMMLVKGDVIGNVGDWVEVLDRAQLGYVNVSNIIKENFNTPILKPTPTPIDTVKPPATGKKSPEK